MTESVYDKQWIHQIYTGLIERYPAHPYNNSYRPKIATSYSSTDGLTYDVQLNPNVRFADGTYLNASDVEYTYKLIINPALEPPDYGLYYQYIDANTDIISEFELTLTFLQDYVFQDSNIAIPIIPKYIWENILPEDQESQAITWATDDSLDSNIMGAGPYYLYNYSFDTNYFIHLKRNDYFDDWSGVTSYFEDIYFEFYGFSLAALNALDSGIVDMVDAHFNFDIDDIPGTV